MENSVVKKLKPKTNQETKTATPGHDTDEFVLPIVEIGDTVLWSPDHGGAPVAAMVTGTGFDGSRIDLQLMHPEMASLDPRVGVPHRDDPHQRVTEDEDLGMWQLSPMHRRLQYLGEELEEIKLSLAGAMPVLDSV